MPYLLFLIIYYYIGQQPFNSKGRISFERHLTPLLSVALLLGASANLFIYSARALEPLRASLLEHLDVALVPLLSFAANRHTKKGMFRSALVAIGATLLILWYDPLAAQENYVRANARSMWGGLSGYSEGSRRSATATSLASIPTPFMNPAQGAIPDEFGNLDLVPLSSVSDGGDGSIADDSNNAPLSPEEEQLLSGEDVGEEDALLLNPAAKRSTDGSSGGTRRVPRRTRPTEVVEEGTQGGGGEGDAVNGASGEAVDDSNTLSDGNPSSETTTKEEGDATNTDSTFNSNNDVDTGTNADSATDTAALPNEIPPPDMQQGDDTPISEGDVAGPSSLGGTEDQQQTQTDQGEEPQTEPEQPEQPVPSAILLPRSRVGLNRGPRMLAEVGKRRAGAGGGRGGGGAQKKAFSATAPRSPPQGKNNLAPSASPSGSPIEDVVSPPPLPPLSSISKEDQEVGGGVGKEEELLTSNKDKKVSSSIGGSSKERLTMRSMGDKAARSVLKQAQKIRNVVEKHERSSVFLAGLLMACAAWLNTMRRRLERQLSDDTKMGHVKLHGIVLITASVMWAPVAVLRWSFSSGNSSSESETRAVAEALDALSTGAQVASSASNSVLEAANLKLANTADAVMLHAGPGIVWFILVAALFGIVHHVLAEWATDFLQFGGERGSVSSSGDRLGGKSQPPSIVAVLTGQATSGVSPSGGGSSPGYQNGGNVSLPHHALGVGGGSTSAANSGAGGGAGAVKSLQGGNTSIASSPDAPLLRTFAMVCTFSSAFFLAWLTGWGYQSSFLLWIGAGVFSLGIAGSAGLESNQFERVFGVLLRGSSSSSTSSQLLNLLFSSLSVCWGVVSGEGHRTYSAEAGGLVPGGSSSSALAAKAWFSGKDSGIGGIPDAAPPSVSFALAARKVLKHILDDSNSRKIFYFLCINFSFMFVEIIGGYFTNSLGLISDAGHMFFDNASLFIGLYASYMSRWRSDSVFTYGYSRYEVLAGFVNAVFLVFIGVSVVVEGVSRLWQPPDIHTEHLLPISIAGLGVNIIGLIFFHDVAHAHGHGGGGDEGGHSDCDGGHHGHSHGGGANENMMGVYLHVLADALGSIGVIISSLMIKYWGWKLADPIASIIISGLILASVIPLLNVTVGPLLQRVPEGSEGKLRAACATLAKSPDIARIENVHFWKLRGETTVGTLHVIARKEADEQRVLRRVQAQFKSLGVSQLTAQIERDDTVFMATTAQTTSNSVKIDSE